MASSACSGLKAVAAGVRETPMGPSARAPRASEIHVALLRVVSLINCPMHSAEFILQLVIKPVGITWGCVWSIDVYFPDYTQACMYYTSRRVYRFI